MCCSCCIVLIEWCGTRGGRKLFIDPAPLDSWFVEIAAVAAAAAVEAVNLAHRALGNNPTAAKLLGDTNGILSIDRNARRAQPLSLWSLDRMRPIAASRSVAGVQECGEDNNLTSPLTAFEETELL